VLHRQWQIATSGSVSVMPSGVSAYNGVHAYNADGLTAAWLLALDAALSAAA
jgi:hypothetical protein